MPEVWTQVFKHTILANFLRYAATALATIPFCVESDGLNMLQPRSRISPSTATRGNIPCLWQVRTAEISTENTSLPSGSESWWRAFLCSTTVSHTSNSAPLLCGGMPECRRNVNRCGVAYLSVALNLRPSCPSLHSASSYEDAISSTVLYRSRHSAQPADSLSLIPLYMASSLR